MNLYIMIFTPSLKVHSEPFICYDFFSHKVLDRYLYLYPYITTVCWIKQNLNVRYFENFEKFRCFFEEFNMALNTSSDLDKTCLVVSYNSEQRHGVSMSSTTTYNVTRNCAYAPFHYRPHHTFLTSYQCNKKLYETETLKN